MISEQMARNAIIEWARSYFAPNIDDPTPDVEVVSIDHNLADDEWKAELNVSTSADHPVVMFWFDEDDDAQELHIDAVEY